MMANLLFPDGKEKALTLSYDDASKADIRFAEMLEKYNIKCTFNVNAGCFGPENEEHIRFRLPESIIKKLYDNPLFEVATHGFKHPSYAYQPAPQCMLDILKDRQELETIFGKIIRGHAYPNGSYNDEVVNILKLAGIVYARTCRHHNSFQIPTDWLRCGTTCHHNDRDLMNLADKFLNGEVKNNDGWLFYLWGHSFEFDRNENWDVIEEFLKKMSNNENVWYATNIEVYEYVTAYRSLVYSANGDMVHNPTATDVWVKVNGNAVSVPAGKTINI